MARTSARWPWSLGARSAAVLAAISSLAACARSRHAIGAGGTGGHAGDGADAAQAGAGDGAGAADGAGGAAEGGGTDGGAPAARGGAGGRPGRAGAAGSSAAGTAAGGAGAPAGTGGGAGSDGAGGTAAGGVAGAAAGGAGVAGSGGVVDLGPVHDRCADPLPLEFVNGQISVSDDLGRATDEFPALVCDSGNGKLSAPGAQIYYRFTARAGMSYALRLDSPFFAEDTLYVFPAGAPCTVDAIESACNSGGDSGATTTAGAVDVLTFAPSEPGEYVVAVDSDYAGVGSGSKFTLTIFEYCGSSAEAGCVSKVCDAGREKTCADNVLSVCNAAGTGYDTTDCTATGATCRNGVCVATVSDVVAYSGWTITPFNEAGASGVTLLDFYAVDTNRTLTEIVMPMTQTSSVPIDWEVFEATTQAGPYQLIASERTMSAGNNVLEDESTGALHVPLAAGRFYAIGASLPGGASYQTGQADTKTLPVPVFFGEVESATVLPTRSPGATLSFPTPGTLVIPQTVKTTI